LRSVIRFAIDTVTLGVVGVLANAGTWWTATSPKTSAADLPGALLAWAPIWIKIALASVAIVTFIDAVHEAWRFFAARLGSAK
jgi:hypothetical protein